MMLFIETPTILPVQLIEFGLVVIFSFLIGLEQGKIHGVDSRRPMFGTDRTFTFIGLLGYVLYHVPGGQPFYFLGGGLVLSALLLVFYHKKISVSEKYGITTILLALIVYCLALVFDTQPLWLGLLVVVIVLLFAEFKDPLQQFTRKIAREEFITLSKFILLAGVILPFLPDHQLATWTGVTPKQIWMAVVVIAGMSYISYLLKRYIFPGSGVVLSGILGGFYSSTATTIILARQSRDGDKQGHSYAAGILFATGAMYVRLIILVFVFNVALAIRLLPYLFIMVIVTAISGWWIYRIGRYSQTGEDGKGKSPFSEAVVINSNPLQLKLAFIFALMFVALSLITQYSLQWFGDSGIHILSWVVGFADIDPFLLNLFQGGFAVDSSVLMMATLQAITSNNLLKLFYGKLFSGSSTGRLVLYGFVIVFGACLVEIAVVALH